MRGGNLKVTSVSDVNKDDTKLLELAVKKRDELLKQVEENGEFDKHQKKLDHNNNPLPKCVACIVARGNPGYQITYEKAGKLIRKSFTDKSKTMDDKLDSAKKYLEELQNDFQGNVNAKEAEKQNDRLDHNKNPLPDRIFKFHQRGIDGYRCIIKKDGKDVKYVCCGKTTSLDDKLASCVKWLEENNL
jgi:seryl-tRNA synthetase